MLVRQANGSRVDVFMLSSSNKVGQMASFPLRRALSATGDQVVNLLRSPTPALVRAIFQRFVSAPTLVAAQEREEQERQHRNAGGKMGSVTCSTQRNLNEAGFQFGARVFFQSWVRYAGRCNTHVRVEAQTTGQDGKCRCDLVLHHQDRLRNEDSSQGASQVWYQQHDVFHAVFRRHLSRPAVEGLLPTEWQDLSTCVTSGRMPLPRLIGMSVTSVCQRLYVTFLCAARAQPNSGC